MTVQSIDAAQRRMTMRDEEGHVSTFTYMGLLRESDDIAVGDTFSLLHVETVTLEMMPGHLQSSAASASW